MNADELARILDELGRRLGPTGEYVFALTVRQVYIEALVVIVATIILIGLGVIVGPRLYRWYDEGESYSGRDLVCLIGGIFYGFALLIGLVFALIAIPKLLNPEFAALERLLGLIR